MRSFADPMNAAALAPALAAAGPNRSLAAPKPSFADANAAADAVCPDATRLAALAFVGAQGSATSRSSGGGDDMVIRIGSALGFPHVAQGSSIVGREGRRVGTGEGEECYVEFTADVYVAVELGP